MDIGEIPITGSILYRLCNSVYDQYKAQHERKFNEGLTKFHSHVEQYLNISVDETNDKIILTFILHRRDIDAT